MIFYPILRNHIVTKSKFLRLSSTVILPDIDTNYYCNSENSLEIDNNIKLRKGVGDVNRVMNMYKKYKATPLSDSSYQIVRENLYKELSCLPGELAELEEALIKYTVGKLLQEKFQLVSVPDILPSQVLESCGMTINSDRTQIYSLDPVHHGPDLYLSGTAEMSLAGLLMNTTHTEEALPLKLAAVSRCFRAETSNLIEERGIYRVHQFTKVEMFAVTTPNQSESMLEYLRTKQEELFSPLGFNMRILDMPPHELGAPAYRKYDIEAWMPGRNNYGEISSCSNCTDYQSRRLHIKYVHNDGTCYVHTLNGTACAVPRMLIALLETHQDPKGKIYIPEVLQPYMNGKKYIAKNNTVPELKLMKIKR
ncbi:serine--tRNA ligase, mitochondrial-like [Helicoverpa zea]|uniref:serine--tRNA ligase, mitochondrial-like n=1 Tax=Helicoverpa zea TaxID=7113 RepID=UPI001F577367|nr:serine--tRNA ligase, mitochondrial-like [Helicoverpa zea]